MCVDAFDDGLHNTQSIPDFIETGRINQDLIDWWPIDPATAGAAGATGEAASIALTALAPPPTANTSALVDPFPRPAVFVLRDTQKWPYQPSGTVEGYKADVCGFLYSHGIDQRFWWCN